MKIVVRKPGLLDTIQDLGRPNYRQMGVPEGGAADRQAMILANRLVGNADGAAGIEFTLHGPTLGFPQGGVIALSGARFEVRCDGVNLHWDETLALAAGTSLELGRALNGCRGYLAVAGGIELEPVLGSGATFLPGAFGGWNGRSLEAGDALPVGVAGAMRLGRANRPVAEGPLRVVAGPQLGWFAESALVGLFGGRFVVDAHSDRSGIRLRGPALRVEKSEELASQGVLPGAIQVPPEGQPIVLGWDGPVTGGYPVIAGIIAADLGRLAQLRPGDRVGFQALDREDARAAWLDQQGALDGSITWLA
ncbi:MAG TPA: biotin-dependent carboxyltransferase family protein [Thiobacillaceae bacterium]|nr:biotin-dependent carboxyltransferase family protein [Thiobacillaceae bacterium]